MPGSVVIFAIVIFLGVVTGLISVTSGAGISYRDEQLHLTIARRLFDSAQPGFQQLGPVWLPIPHLILALFVLNFSWWESGVGAAIVGTMCLGASSTALYRITCDAA